MTSFRVNYTQSMGGDDVHPRVKIPNNVTRKIQHLLLIDTDDTSLIWNHLEKYSNVP